MATYGENILPAFNSGWQLVNCTHSGIELVMQANGYATYTWLSEDFHIGDKGYVSLSVTSGKYYIYISYMDKDSSQTFVYHKYVTAGFSLEIELSSAIIDSLTARIVCVEAGRCSTYVLKTSSVSNTSGGGGGGVTPTSNIRTFRSRFNNSHPSFDRFDYVDYGSQQYDTSTYLLNELNNHSIMHLGCQRSHEYCITQLIVSLDSSIVRDTASVKIDATTSITLWDSEQPVSTSGNPYYSEQYPTKTEKFLKEYPVLIRLYFGDILLAEQKKVLLYKDQRGFEAVNLSYTMYSDALLERDRSQTIPIRLCVKPENDNENDAYTSLQIAVDTTKTSIVATGPILLKEAYTDTGNTYRYSWNYDEPLGNFVALYEPNSDIINQILFTAGCDDSSYNRIGFWSFDYSGNGYKTEQEALNTNLRLNTSYQTSFYKKMEWATVTDVHIPIIGDSAALKVTTSDHLYHIGLGINGNLYFRYYTGDTTASFIIDTNVIDFDCVQCGLWQDKVTSVEDPYDRIFGLTIFYIKHFEPEDEWHIAHNDVYAVNYPPINQQNVDIDTQITSLSQFETRPIDLVNPQSIGFGYMWLNINVSALYLFDRSPVPAPYSGIDCRSLIFGITANSDSEASVAEVYFGCIHFDSGVWPNRHADDGGPSQRYLAFYGDDMRTRNPGTGAYYCESWDDPTVTSDSTAYSQNLDKYGRLSLIPYCTLEYCGCPDNTGHSYAPAFGDTTTIHSDLDDSTIFIPIRVLSTYCGDRRTLTNVNQFVFNSSSEPVYDYHLAICGNLYVPTLLDTYRIYPSSTRNGAYKRFDQLNKSSSAAFSRSAAWPTPGTTAIIYNMLPSGKIAALQLFTRFLYNFGHYFTGLYFTESMMPQIHLNKTSGDNFGAEDIFVYFPTNENTPLEMNYEFNEDSLGATLRMCIYANYLGTSASSKASYQLMLQRYRHCNSYYSFNSTNPKGYFNIQKDWQYTTISPNQRSTVLNVSDHSAKSEETHLIDYYIADITPRLPYLGYNTTSYSYSVYARPYRPNEFFYCGWGINA